MEKSNKQHIIEMESGGKIALYRLKPPNPVGFPLIVTHGTISNAKVVRGLGRFLARLGFDCWLLEWGGHGQSEAASSWQNFEYPAFHDVPAAITAVLTYTQQAKLFWVSHSGGGHLPLMYLARDPAREAKIAGLVTMGAQATDAALPLGQKVKAGVFWGVTMLLGRTPLRMLPMGNEPEPTRLLAQWFIWNIRQRWLGVDGFDYMAALTRLTIPALMFAGGNDIIAPASGCRKFFEAMGSVDKSWFHCAVSAGFSEDYNHAQLVIGRGARKELFPKVGDWLRQRNNG